MGFKVKFEDDIDGEDFGNDFEVFEIKETLCKVVNAEETTVNQGLNAALTFDLIVVEGEHDSKRAGSERLMFHSSGLRERAFFVLRRCGIPESQLRDPNFEVSPELVNKSLVRVTTKIGRSCGGEGCFAKVKIASKKDDQVIYKCTECAWEGDDPFQKMEPTYAGYEFASADDSVENKPAAGEVDDLSDLDF